MLIAWILSSILVMRGRREFVPLCVVLGIAFSEELMVAWLHARGREFVWIYHIYVTFEYALFGLYFMQGMRKNYRRAIAVTILLFTLASLSISYWYYHFRSFPGVNINTAGVLICLICTYKLLTLDIHQHDAIYKHPDFWICLGQLIFFGGTFFSNGLYTYLLKTDAELAKQLFASINKPLNLIQYSCVIIGFLCAIPRKSTTQLS